MKEVIHEESARRVPFLLSHNMIGPLRGYFCRSTCYLSFISILVINVLVLYQNVTKNVNRNTIMTRGQEAVNSSVLDKVLLPGYQHTTLVLPRPTKPPGSPFRLRDREWDHLRHHGYVIANEKYCEVRPGQEVFLVVTVMSDPRDRKSRQFFRSTFGSVKEHRGKLLRILYAVGRTFDTKVESDVASESDAFGDIVKFDMLDSYSNFTLKSLLTLSWTATHCSHAKFYMKVGHDVVVNFRRIVDYFIEVPARNMMTGVLREDGGRTAHHLRGAPWARSPGYIIGHITIQSVDTVKELYLESLHHPLFCEDQFVSFIARKLNITLIDNQYFRACPWENMMTNNTCDILQVFSIHTQPFHGAPDWSKKEKKRYWEMIHPTSPESRQSCDRNRKWMHDNRKDCNYLAPEK
ncbi:beta-1,3-galactosyltransferase 1 isoform X1 [Lingula anatina]|uniref:Hexosyltransferase n=2 Tax=Lingula anatina TaxID=7574 RepID=A0A1S3IAX6_LINAN|nr:beta-1,3-galactosyltransferase 1 isoform X1 [Lingula anatina]|eukprot:XP_013395412.1 beta-1,3-galactosyltransferase 1 isoform X1 [Lingula anatina]